jgi:hypothetical protein
MLLSLTDLIENGMHYCINPIFSYCNYGIYDLELNFGIVRIDRITATKDGLSPILHNNGVHYTLNEAHVWISTLRLVYYDFGCRRVLKLGLSLLEHLLLFGSYPLSLCFFLLSDPGLVLGNLLLSTLAAPALALPRPEVICPLMALVALDKDSGHLFNDDYLDEASMALRLATHSLHNLHTVVTNALLTICELPKSNLTPIARLLSLWAGSL